MSTTINTARRSISTLNEVAPGIFLNVTTSHYKERKAYLTSVSRETHEGGIVRFRLYEDMKSLASTETKRYSQKQLKEIHEQQAGRVNHPSYIGWAREIVPA